MLMNLDGGRSNPLFDPFVEAGYLGYSIRATAHRQPYKMFCPSLRIRDCRSGVTPPFYERMLQKSFIDADAAIGWAMGIGRRVIDDHIRMMNLDEPIEM